MTAESHGHALPCFQAWRRLDEILLANFMVFHDVVADDPYDLWLGDEAWELDYYLHENPELKTAPFCFLTDFVGWLPMPEGGEEEARLTRDYNAEMIEQIARFPHVRDRAIFVGSPDDVIPRDFGVGLPEIRPWVEEHFDFSGYVLAPGAGRPVDRSGRRAELGYREPARRCASSRLAARASAPISCTGSSPGSRRHDNGRPSFAWRLCADRASTRPHCPRTKDSMRTATWTTCRNGWQPATRRSCREV